MYVRPERGRRNEMLNLKTKASEFITAAEPVVSMRLGIDASNIRDGGGLGHLRELLAAAEPHKYGIKRVVVWAGRDTLRELTAKPWLDCNHDPMLDGPLPLRVYWQRVKLARLAEQCCDYLFVPGGSYSGNFKPFVTMSQNLLPYEGTELRRYGFSWMTLKLAMLRMSQTRTFRRADAVTFLTEYARSTIKQAAKLCGHQPIIPYGLSSRFDMSPRSQRPMSSYSNTEPFRLLYVSKLEPYKHQWHVAEAVAELRGEGLPVVLELIGGAYRPSLRRLRRTMELVDPANEFIHYLGPIPHADLVKHYHQADGFVFASSCESLPNILLEAMASGLPIACSNRGPMPEVLGDAGVYFNPEKPAEIADALRLLLTDPGLRERCSRAAFERAQAYSWQRCANETFAYISKLAQAEAGRTLS